MRSGCDGSRPSGKAIAGLLRERRGVGQGVLLGGASHEGGCQEEPSCSVSLATSRPAMSSSEERPRSRAQCSACLWPHERRWIKRSHREQAIAEGQSVRRDALYSKACKREITFASISRFHGLGILLGSGSEGGRC